LFVPHPARRYTDWVTGRAHFFSTLGARRTLVQLLLLILLVTQQAAYAHAVTHLAKSGADKELPNRNKACDSCASFDKLSGAAPLSLPAFFVLDKPLVELIVRSIVFKSYARFFFQSRGPPQLL